RHGSPFGPDLGLRQNHYPLWSVLTQTTIFIRKEDSLLTFPEIEAFCIPGLAAPPPRNETATGQPHLSKSEYV
ncbi:MAG TPA: hypothetical protein VN578_09455, partial [Candidatus Binatia bacterium]|nr:hypothetical protein [Candidatus Binatia bacterium]